MVCRLCQARLIYCHLALTLVIGLFLGSGRSLAGAGPGGAVLCYLLMATVISSVISCLGEMTALMPVNAPVMEFPRRFVDRGVGFAVGWVYWSDSPYNYSLIITLTCEQLADIYWLTGLPTQCLQQINLLQ